jgi:hypothetical protein
MSSRTRWPLSVEATTAVALRYELHSSTMQSMDATVTGRPADATWYSLKPSKLTAGTSVRLFVPIIDHDVEEEDHDHGLAAVRGRSIVVDETGGRNRSRL